MDCREPTLLIIEFWFMGKTEVLKLFLINSVINPHERIRCYLLRCFFFDCRQLRLAHLLSLLLDRILVRCFHLVGVGRLSTPFFSLNTWVCILSSLRLWLRLVFFTELNDHLLMVFCPASYKWTALVNVHNAHVLAHDFLVTAAFRRIRASSCILLNFGLTYNFSLFLSILLCFQLVFSRGILFLLQFLLFRQVFLLQSFLSVLFCLILELLQSELLILPEPFCVFFVFECILLSRLETILCHIIAWCRTTNIFVAALAHLKRARRTRSRLA